MLLGASILASCSIGGGGPELNVYPPGIELGITDWDYGFQFLVMRVPREVREVTFTWSFSGDPDSAGSETIPVRFRRASHGIRHRFGEVFVGDLTVKATGTGLDLEVVYPVSIGLVREYSLPACGEEEWADAADGGHGTTRDTWDIAAIPAGAEFDIEYDALNKPDRFIIYYDDNEVLDTGWRGRGDYESDPTAPLEGPGAGEEEGFFTKDVADTFVVSVHGPHPGTVWRYRIRCRVE